MTAAVSVWADRADGADRADKASAAVKAILRMRSPRWTDRRTGGQEDSYKGRRMGERVSFARRPALDAPRTSPLLSSTCPSLPTPEGHSAPMAQILVVDDEEVVRRFAARVLLGRGHTVAEAADGRKALAKVEELGSDVRLVLSDIVMPSMNGVELTEQLSILRPDLPVILMSGYSPVELMAQ